MVSISKSLADDLRRRPRIAGHYVTAVSPSADSVTIMWPDGGIQSASMRTDPSQKAKDGAVVVRRATGEECYVYRRGPGYDDILGQIEEEVQRQDDEIQAVLTEMTKESDQRIAGVMAGDVVETVTEDVLPMSALCDYDSPHYDCEICPDPDTGEIPKHHSTPQKLAGHKRSNLHAANEAAA